MSKHAVETTVLRRFEWTEARGGFSEEKLGFLHDASLLRKPTNHKIWHKIQAISPTRCPIETCPSLFSHVLTIEIARCLGSRFGSIWYIPIRIPKNTVALIAPHELYNIN
jgi:hypothetical protein